MKNSSRFFLLALVSVLCTGCWTSIVTVAPPTTVSKPVVVPAPVQTTTTVVAQRPKTTTTTVMQVSPVSDDISFYLDLQAVAALFAQSNSVQDFEQLLNSSAYIINNLDLNRDGYVDYLRVLETTSGYTHCFLLQACLARNVYQDVATLVAEVQTTGMRVQVIGDSYIYGANYIVQPVYVKVPSIWNLFRRPQYNPWRSPYHWDYMPSYYKRPVTVYLSHYQAYVVSYMSHHDYCHHCDYPSQYYYPNYQQVIRADVRHDYATQYPDRAFSSRQPAVQTVNSSRVDVRNASDLRRVADASRTTTTTSSSTPSASRTQTTSSSTPSASRTQTTSSSTSSASRTQTASSSTSSASRTQTASSSTPSASRTQTTSSSTSSASRTQTATPSTSRSSATVTTPTHTANTTTMTTRVNSAGRAQSTAIRSQDAVGRTTTTQRTTSAPVTRPTGTVATPTRSTSTTTTTPTSSRSTSTSTPASRTQTTTPATRR